MGTLRFFEEVVSFKIRRTFGFADYKSRANVWKISCEERIYHLLAAKGGAKSVRRAKKSGNGRRLAPKTLRGQARARVFDGASAARSSSRFFAMRNDCALRATMILIPFTRF